MKIASVASASSLFCTEQPFFEVHLLSSNAFLIFFRTR